MMGSISADIREGLVETFYGVYEKDPDKVRRDTRPCLAGFCCLRAVPLRGRRWGMPHIHT